MIGRLLARFRRQRTARSSEARLGNLVLVVSRKRLSQRTGAVAQKRIGRYRISLLESSRGSIRDAADARLEELAERLAARLDARARETLFEFVAAASAPYLDGPDGIAVAHGLRLLRDKLIATKLPGLPPEINTPPLAVIDAIVRLDERRFWITGWARDENGKPPEVTMTAPDGERVPLLPGAPRFDRKDVAESLAAAGVVNPRKNGYAKYVELRASSPLSDGWLAELRISGADPYELRAPPVTSDSSEARGTMIAPFAAGGPELETLRRDHAFPALRLFQERASRSVEIESEVQHGKAPEEPDVSIVVPLYRRIDLIEHQVAQFWRDPDLRRAELIYVLDSPERAGELSRLAGPLYELYGLPIKILNLSRNGGYAVANNLGASRARGRLLLLMNSDVLPTARGWLRRMHTFYDATPDIGALGPKLLYEDESIQHAGMYFKRDAATRLWENQHYFKGFARTLPAAGVTRPVPAVTGACMMVERVLFDRLGGFATLYVDGGYEDSDFCIRLVHEGKRNWYLADVELYHLEAQSFFIHARLANPCNVWIQTHLWNDRIERLMSASWEVTASPLVAVG